MPISMAVGPGKKAERLSEVVLVYACLLNHIPLSAGRIEREGQKNDLTRVTLKKLNLTSYLSPSDWQIEGYASIYKPTELLVLCTQEHRLWFDQLPWSRHTQIVSRTVLETCSAQGFLYSIIV